MIFTLMTNLPKQDVEGSMRSCQEYGLELMYAGDAEMYSPVNDVMACW